ncbi:MAG: ATP-binding cassette domain-containing protein [Planctomycetota bacterium]|jgi:phospholipid/cholesterol/gamma-HCH transport system ATP-binding protein|nr:ATP-binding cassette domain-containing protein [Planctomycetota bacterium]
MSEEWSDEAMEQAVTMPEVPADRELFIRIRALHKRFGPRHILRGIDLDVYRGETVTILGLSGSGKSTLMKHLTGSLRLDEGHIQVGPYDLADMNRRTWDAYRRDMGVVFQHAALLGSLTVEDNVGLPLLEVERLSRSEVRPRVIEALHRVFLPAEEILHLSPSDLSGGMQKRVGLARAIIREPALLLYDEPTTGLDPVTVSGVNELTLELQGRLGVTSLVITHDLDAAFTIADRIAMLYKGRIIACAPPDEIRQSQHPVLQQLLSGSTTGPLTEAFTT